MDPFAPFAESATYSIPPFWHRGAHSYVNPSRYEPGNNSGYVSAELDFHHPYGECSDGISIGIHNHTDPGHRSWDGHRYRTPATMTDPYECNSLAFRKRKSSIHSILCRCYTCCRTPHSYPRVQDRQQRSEQTYRHRYREPSTLNTFDTPMAKASRKKGRRNAVSEPSTTAHLDTEDHEARVPAALPSLSCRVVDQDEEGQEEEREEEDGCCSPLFPARCNQSSTGSLPPGCRRVSPTYPDYDLGTMPQGNRNRIPSPVYGLPGEVRQRSGDEHHGRHFVGAWQELRRRRGRLERKLERVEEREEVLRRLERADEWDE